MKMTITDKDGKQRQIVNIKSLEIDKFGIVVNFDTHHPSWEVVMLPHGRVVKTEMD